MNEEQKEHSEQARFPLKTKISMIWLVISGIIIIVGPQLPLIGFTDYQERNQIVGILFLITVPIAFLWILPCILLLFRKKWAYMSAVVLLSFIALASLIASFYFWGGYFFYGSILLPVVCVPLVLIIVDRENYLEMVHQRQSSKNYISHNQPQQKLKL
ncbi:MAG: hypothetical protein WC562_06695 [Dehalococcoidia bacterium]